MNEHINICREATNIIRVVTEAFMSSSNFKPNDVHELYDTMVEQCSHILVERFLAQKYSPMQYHHICSQIAEYLFDSFIGYM